MGCDPSNPPTSHPLSQRRTSAPPMTPRPPHLSFAALHDATPLSSPTTQPISLQLPSDSLHSQRPLRPSRRLSAVTSLPTAPGGSSLSSSAPPVPLNLGKLARGVIPSRTGSVLSRGLILKSDYHFVAPPSSSQTEASAFADPPAHSAADAKSAGYGGFHLSGATNFRDGGLGVWGVAQPSETGVMSVLTVLRSRHDLARDEKGQETVWFCTREEPILYIVLFSRGSYTDRTFLTGAQPFVLRDAAHPTRTYSISNRAENLEEIEARLKQDVIRESQCYGGLVLVHDEAPSSSPSSSSPCPITPTWVSADNVRTISELFAQIRAKGYNVTYHRTPVGRDQSPGDGYLDLYTSLLAGIPTSSSLVFNCGVGVVRTTFAMSAALIVRRKQLIEAGMVDPYELMLDKEQEVGSPKLKEKDRSTAKEMLRMRSEQATRDHSLLRLMHVLSKSLPARSQGAILSVLSSQSSLLENLRAALLGNYDIILSLLSCLDDASATKKVVDAIIDHCDTLVNLRESVLQHRVRYASLALLDESSAAEHRQQALAALERYFFLLTFAAFVAETPLPSTTALSSDGKRQTFSSWLNARSEIARMIGRMKKTGHFFVFSPVHDLSAIAKGDAGELTITGGTTFAKGRYREMGGADMVGDEWATQIIRNRSGIILRSGMILKSDQWLFEEGQEQTVRGAINFRRVQGSSLYGLSQPTEEGIRGGSRRVLDAVKADLKPGARTVWINLREEPLVYINGVPYVLRQQAVSLRNVKSYSGISPTRLEILEQRLKSDVLAELRAFDGRILLASEDPDDGSVNPVWETVEDPERQVKTLREVMDAAREDAGLGEEGERFRYIRVPITAEKFPEFNDLREILETVTLMDSDDAIIVNDQLGRGRTTRTLVIITLVLNWFRHGGKGAPRSHRYSYTCTPPLPSFHRRSSHLPPLCRNSVINNLLRAVPHTGAEVKNAVDQAITVCGHPFDLLNSIEDARQHAEDAKTDFEREKWIARGLRELRCTCLFTSLTAHRVRLTACGDDLDRAYFFLLLLTCFLTETRPETWRDLGQSSSYEDFVRQRPVFKTIERELDLAGIDALIPLERPLLGDGTASNDEAAEFVAKRGGRVLSAFTLLKSDFFSGLQKMSLPERVDGAPNFRRVPLSFAANANKDSDSGPVVYGTGMPTVEGLRRALERMGARATDISWTSMREEPVLYVRSRPHVLRLFSQPLENVITTGVTTATVEAMEAELKRDLLRERESTGGKVLLHDEIEENGSFTVTAMWEEVQPEECVLGRSPIMIDHPDLIRILTPLEVFAMMEAEGLKVDYDRLPVTDEQSPIPGVFSRIEQRVSAALSRSDKTGLAMNCQMGRGRTTTGMVATALVYNILFARSAAFDMAASYVEQPEHGDSWDGREADPYLQGDYKVVLQLVGVLRNGKDAKRLTDLAIDNMEAVQNLRTAIYSFKLRVEAAEIGSKKREKLFNQALNYLYRFVRHSPSFFYATLIVFANFLLDKASHLDETGTVSSSNEDEDEEGGGRGRGRGVESTFQPFEEYLKERPEISRILKRRTLD
ncbi:SPOSA6832_04952 [Sporobolomyces salmonicolor]|uniref:SPOSA6832_04952-mRNA-1:cds n=1 Tax=Sporidiobolus salmonicolor TaxID=5005 RepID=A0A0D6ESF7_SPOSA|nr:SPOSA6832_04952 [Sporobolomyces salmonicolor]